MSAKYMITADRGQIIGRRKRQEDSVDGGLAADQSVYFVLADGMGGHEGGDKASQAAVAAFGQTLRQEGDLRKALYATNDFLSYLKSQGKLPESAGCTLIGVKIQGTTCSAISVGDSYLYRQTLNGELLLLNKLHNQGAELDAMVESGQLTAEQAAEAPNRNALTSAVTGAPLRIVDSIEPFELEVGERLILLSDGYLTIGHASLEKILNHYPAEDAEAPQKIVSQVLKRVDSVGFALQDNTSIITVQLTPMDTKEGSAQFTGFDSQEAARSLTPKLIAVLVVLLVTCGLCGYLALSGCCTDTEEHEHFGGGAGTVRASYPSALNLNSSRTSTSVPNVDAQSVRAWQQLFGMLKHSNEEKLRSVVMQNWNALENVRGASSLEYQELEYILNMLRDYERSLSGCQPGDGSDVENGKWLQSLVFEGMLYRASLKDNQAAAFSAFVQKDLIHYFNERLLAFKKGKDGSTGKLEQYIELCAGLDGRELIKHMPKMLAMVKPLQNQKGAENVLQKMDDLLLYAVGYQNHIGEVEAVTRARYNPSVWPDLYRIMKERAQGEDGKCTLFTEVGKDDVVGLTQNLAHIYACNKKPMSELLPDLQNKPIMEHIKTNAYRSYSSMEEADKQVFAEMLLHHMAPSEHQFSLDDLLKIMGRSKSEVQTILPAIAVITDAKKVSHIVPELATHLSIDKTPKKRTKNELRQNDIKKAKFSAALIHALSNEKASSEFLASCKVFCILSMSCSSSIGENGSLSDYKIKKIMTSYLQEDELEALYWDIINDFDGEIAYLEESKVKFLPNLGEEVQREVSKRKQNIEKWWNGTTYTSSPKSGPSSAPAAPSAPAGDVQPANPTQQPNQQSETPPHIPESTSKDIPKVVRK